MRSLVPLFFSYVRMTWVEVSTRNTALQPTRSSQYTESVTAFLKKYSVELWDAASLSQMWEYIPSFGWLWANPSGTTWLRESVQASNLKNGAALKLVLCKFTTATSRKQMTVRAQEWNGKERETNARQSPSSPSLWSQDPIEFSLSRPRDIFLVDRLL